MARLILEAGAVENGVVTSATREGRALLDLPEREEPRRDDRSRRSILFANERLAAPKARAPAREP
jgi:hypothetical protein